MDVAVALIIALLTLVLSGLGISMNEPKSWHKFAFIIIGLLMLILIGFQAYRNSELQEALQAKLNKIGDNIEELPSNIEASMPKPQIHKERTWVVMNPSFVRGKRPPFTSNRSFIMNINIKNVGSVPAGKIGTLRAVYSKDRLLSMEDERQLYKEFRSSIDKIPDRPERSLGPGQGDFFTVNPNPKLTAKTAADLADGKLYYYILALTMYEDDAGSHETEFCVIFWGKNPVFRNCRVHNGPK